MTPQILDIILIVGALAFGIYGLSMGIIRQIGSVAALFVGYLAAKIFSDPVSQSLGVNHLICAVAIFVIAYVGIKIIAGMLHKTVSLVFLGPIDHILGGVFGILNWLVITSLLLNLFMYCKPDAEVLTGKVTQFTLTVLPKLLGIAQQYIS